MEVVRFSRFSLTYTGFVSRELSFFGVFNLASPCRYLGRLYAAEASLLQDNMAKSMEYLTINDIDLSMADSFNGKGERFAFLLCIWYKNLSPLSM